MSEIKFNNRTMQLVDSEKKANAQARWKNQGKSGLLQRSGRALPVFPSPSYLHSTHHTIYVPTIRTLHTFPRLHTPVMKRAWRLER